MPEAARDWLGTEIPPEELAEVPGIPRDPTGALEPFHSRLGRRPALAYGLLGFTIL